MGYRAAGERAMNGPRTHPPVFVSPVGRALRSRGSAGAASSPAPSPRAAASPAPLPLPKPLPFLIRSGPSAGASLPLLSSSPVRSRSLFDASLLPSSRLLSLLSSLRASPPSRPRSSRPLPRSPLGSSRLSRSRRSLSPSSRAGTASGAGEACRLVRRRARFSESLESLMPTMRAMAKRGTSLYCERVGVGLAG